jgi:hypothetical protein
VSQALNVTRATVEFAPHVGRYVAAADAAGGALLAVVLAACVRGEHRVSVMDARTWEQVASFRIPSRAKSGITPIRADGEVLLTNDDHGVTAFAARTGARLWERAFPAPGMARLVGVAKGRALVVVVHADNTTEARLLRIADGGDERVLSESIVPSMETAVLGDDGTVVVVGMRYVRILRPGQPMRHLELVAKRFGMADAAALDEAEARVAIGTRAGEVLVMDLESGVATTVLEMDDQVRSVGFHGGAPWALDGAGRLRILGDGDARVSVDLGLETYGGLLSPDAKTMSLGSLSGATFHVRALPSNEERFATLPGFACRAVAIDARGALLLADEERTLRLDPATGTMKKVAPGAEEIVRVADGTLVFTGRGVRVMAPGATKLTPLAKLAEEAWVAAGALFVLQGTVAEVWDLATAKRTWRVDVGKTWIGEETETLRFVHLGPDGRPWIHLTDGAVWRADALESDSGFVKKLSEGTLWPHPDGRTLLRASGRTLAPIAVDTLDEGPPLPLAVDADVTKVVLSPSGRRLAALHRNGRLSCVDLASGRAVAVDAPDTSAAERAPDEVFVIDLVTPHGCAFSPSEETVAWTHAGGVTFADAATGALRGTLVVATAGRDYLATDGSAFDWSGARGKRKKPVSNELVAREGVVASADAGVLARLTR